MLRGHELANRSTPQELDEREDQDLFLDGRWGNSHELLAGDLLIDHDGRPRRVLRIELEPGGFVAGGEQTDRRTAIGGS